MFGIGAMAGLIGAKVAFTGARQLLSVKPPSLSELLLAPANAQRVAEQLSRMRGAAMKMGQLLPMDAGQILPEEWSTILARLQADASPMPAFQLELPLRRYCVDLSTEPPCRPRRVSGFLGLISCGFG